MQFLRIHVSMIDCYSVSEQNEEGVCVSSSDVIHQEVDRIHNFFTKHSFSVMFGSSELLLLQQWIECFVSDCNFMIWCIDQSLENRITRQILIPHY
jgi:hypothetical protein